MENKQLVRLIDKYLADECTAEEAQTVERWYESHIQTEREFYGGSGKERRKSRQRSLDALRVKLGLTDQSAAKGKIVIRKNVAWQWVAAASVTLFTLFGSLYYFQKNKEQPVYTYVTTKNGQIKQIELPDGTKVWLNAGTILKYASDYNQYKREIYLDGEAFFDVVHDENRPFDIYSGKVKTHVLGTAFSVSSYPGALVQTVTVTRGKVQVSAAKNVPAYLLPNQKLEFNKNTNKSVVVAADASRITSWKDGKLAFIDMPMQDIAVHLQKWYGVKFVFKNQQLKVTRLTASFNNDINLLDLLAVMYDVSHVKYSIDEKNQIITY